MIYSVHFFDVWKFFVLIFGMARKYNIAFFLLVFVDKMVYIYTPLCSSLSLPKSWCVVDILLIRFSAYRLAADP